MTAEKGYRHRLVRRARRVNIGLSADVADRLAVYLDLLEHWNRRINLTALEDPDAAVDRLVLEPALASKHLPVRATVLDIGSGGGSPAIPLRILVPGISLTLVEAKTRKSAFLREAVRRLELDRVVVENCRFEELLAMPERHESTDVITIRAVRVETAILMNLQAFLKVGGEVFLFRGPGQIEPARWPIPLVMESEEPLVESLRSRLVRLRRVGVGASQVNAVT